MADKIRWGILGAANIGRKVIPAIHQAKNSVVSAVASRDQAKAQAYADELNIPTAYGSYEALLNDPNIDAIYIPIPNGLHYEWSLKCAAAGKPTLCEKPLTANAAEARELVETFEQAGLTFAEAFMYRHHPMTRRVVQMVREGVIGKVSIIAASFTFPIRREDDVRLNNDLAGGALMDVGCYPVSLMRMVTGEEPDEALAIANFGSGSQVDETLSGVLHFPSGIVGHFDCGFRTFLTNSYEIRGSNGKINVEPSFTMPADQPSVIRLTTQQDGKSRIEEIEIAPANSYQLMAEDFAAAIQEKRPPLYDGRDAISQMHTIDMLYQSARA